MCSMWDRSPGEDLEVSTVGNGRHFGIIGVRHDWLALGGAPTEPTDRGGVKLVLLSCSKKFTV